MDEDQAGNHLLNVLEERGLDVDLDKILLGFEDADTKHEAAAWVEEYLHEDTLLTKEELELYVCKIPDYHCKLRQSQIPDVEEEKSAASI
jgi:hypothetical protein